uniref:COMM domain-containing protein n=1 Tax=Lepeophtheirus salmonis TaxID=72036 RepID=A0A0K2V268_LEPSM
MTKTSNDEKTSFGPCNMDEQLLILSNLTTIEISNLSVEDKKNALRTLNVIHSFNLKEALKRSKSLTQKALADFKWRVKCIPSSDNLEESFVDLHLVIETLGSPHQTKFVAHELDTSLLNKLIQKMERIESQVN